MSKSSAIEQRRKRLYSIVETGNVGDIWSRGYAILLVAAILINLAVCVAYTFDEMELKYGPELLAVEFVTVSFFAVDWLHVRGGLLVLPFVAWGYVLAVCERRHESLAEEPETIPDNTAYPSV